MDQERTAPTPPQTLPQTPPQQALRELEAQQRAILASTSDGMILVAPDCIIQFMNRRFGELLEIEPEQAIGRSFDDFRTHAEAVFADPKAFFSLVTGTATDTTSQLSETIRQRWPQPRELMLTSVPVHDDSGGFFGRLYVLRDVSREREAERVKDEFVSMVSHELRTPLTSINGYVELLLDGDVGELSADQLDFLRVVKHNADRLLALVNDLLDISRLESGKVRLHVAPLDLAALVSTVVRSFRPQMESKRQPLEARLPDHLNVLGDPERLMQVLTNLLSNAHKYTPEGGRITLTLREQDGQAVVDVTDTGVGMTTQEQAQVFTRFFRAKNRATQEAGGTGLGLVITRQLVEMHGGTINLASEPGVGTTFTVTLPLAPSAVSVVPLPTGEAPGATETLQVPATSATILVVDDEPDIARLLSRYLERAGHHVTTASSGTEALQQARELHPDLITLDVMMPDADGFTVLEWLKSDEATAAIPVVMLSIIPDQERGALLGAVDYIAKPVSQETLVARIGQVLAAAHPERRPGSVRILLAEDDADVRRLYVPILQHSGYEVVEAADGEQAVELALREHPVLVLMDVKMPRMDGIEALARLRQLPQTRELPVIMLTASPGVLEAKESVVAALGGATLLSKPCTADQLAATIVRGLRTGGVPFLSKL